MFKILLVNRGDAAFGIWKNITSAEKHTSAMELAAILNSVYQKNVLTFPTLEGMLQRRLNWLAFMVITKVRNLKVERMGWQKCLS